MYSPLPAALGARARRGQLRQHGRRTARQVIRAVTLFTPLGAIVSYRR
jgi:hypothetical protein